MQLSTVYISSKPSPLVKQVELRWIIATRNIIALYGTVGIELPLKVPGLAASPVLVGFGIQCSSVSLPPHKVLTVYIFARCW
jgi:hypothetical protein